MISPIIKKRGLWRASNCAVTSGTSYLKVVIKALSLDASSLPTRNCTPDP